MSSTSTFSLQCIDLILQWLSSYPPVVSPRARLNEARGMLKSSQGMDDLSVSRLSAQAPWGITVPTDKSHTVYVWLDALANYLTVARHHSGSSNKGESSNDDNLDKRWPASYHIVGKDILKFHTVYWPAFLLAADLAPPKQVIAHAHWLVDGQKMSKSIGNVVAPSDLISRFGVDAVRYFLLRDGGLVNDGDFSESMLVQKTNKELADVYGNLVRRCSGKLKQWPSIDCLRALDDDPSCQQLSEMLHACPARVDKLYRTGDIQHAILEIMMVLQESNAFFQNHEPWAISKTLRNHAAAQANGKDVDDVDVDGLTMRFDAIHYMSLEAIRVATILLQPVVPSMTEKVLQGIGLSESERSMSDACVTNAIADARPLCQPIGVLFTKVEAE
jgi:methionyl-tRNA synthetase